MASVLGDPDWVLAYGEVKIDWFHHTVGFSCACGEPGLILSEDGDERTCPKCKRRYWLGVQFRMNEADMIGVSG